MATSQRDVRNRIGAVKNIQKITRAMEMVAAARLRRAEQRIEALRPYADAIRRMTRQAAEAAGTVPRLPILSEHEQVNASDCCWWPATAGWPVRSTRTSFAPESRPGASTRRGGGSRVLRLRPPAASSLTFRGLEIAESFTGFTDRPTYADARRIAERLMAAYVDGEVDLVEIFYNRYISPLSRWSRRETLLPLSRRRCGGRGWGGGSPPRRRSTRWSSTSRNPRRSSARLVPDYVEISIYRALLESTASEHGARMTAMRNASQNASTLIDDLVLEMNRARQAEITQEILEVVAGAEGLSG